MAVGSRTAAGGTGRFDTAAHPFDTGQMKGLSWCGGSKKLGRARNLKVQLVTSRAKGSHAILRFGSAATTIPDLQRELKTGTLHAILKALGLTPEDSQQGA